MMQHQSQQQEALHATLPNNVEGDGIMRNSAPPTASTSSSSSSSRSGYPYQHNNNNNIGNTTTATNNNSAVDYHDPYRQGNGYSNDSINRSGGICNSIFCCTSSSPTTTSIFTCCTTIHIICNTILIIALCVMVSLMAIQIHNMQQELIVDENEIAALKKQVESQTQNQQDLNQRVEQEHSLTMYQMAGTFTLLTCLITAFHITQHLSNYNEAVVQRKIIAILWMSPIYSVTSFLSLIFPHVDEYLAVVKDCYEAYTIYTFLSFLIAVLGRGDRNAAIQVLACHADHLHPPTKCLSFLYNKNNIYNQQQNYPSSIDEEATTAPPATTNAVAIASAVLTECQILAMQFVFIRPITSLMLFISDTIIEGHNDKNLDSTTTDDDGNPYTSYFLSPNFYIAIITNISVFFAFNGLLKFYHAVRDDLKWCQPFNKFVSIKSIVFLTFWQGLLVSIIVNVNYPSSSNTTTTSIQVPTLSPTRIPDIYPVNAPMSTPTVVYTSPSIPTLSNPLPPPQSMPSTKNEVSPTTDNKAHNSTNLLRRYYQNRHNVRFLDDHTVDKTTSTNYDESNKEEEGGGEDQMNSNDNNDEEGYDTANDGKNSNQQSNDDNDSNNNNTQHQRAAQIQNFLICFEMLLFAIGHWCVFPAEEWKPDYRPQTTYGTPGFGISDFAKDISDIVRGSNNAARQQRRIRRAVYTKHTNTTLDDGTTKSTSGTAVVDGTEDSYHDGYVDEIDNDENDNNDNNNNDVQHVPNIYDTENSNDDKDDMVNVQLSNNSNVQNDQTSTRTIVESHISEVQQHDHHHLRAIT